MTHSAEIVDLDTYRACRADIAPRNVYDLLADGTVHVVTHSRKYGRREWYWSEEEARQVFVTLTAFGVGG